MISIMKNLKKYIGISLMSLAVLSCDEYDSLVDERIDLNPDITPVTPTGDPGSADFSNYVALGASVTAGMMDAAIYDYSEANSYPVLLATQMKYAGGGDFTIPNINSVNGINAANPSIGRFILETCSTKNPCECSAGPTSVSIGEAFSAWTGSGLNNFGVVGLRSVDLGVAGYGTKNPYFGRFAADAATSTVLGDAVAAKPTFFSVFIGGNDVLGWAQSGGTGIVSEGSQADYLKTSTLTDVATFTAASTNALNVMSSGGTVKGVVVNIPPVTYLPFFRAVTWNAIAFDIDSDCPSDQEGMTEGQKDAGTIQILNSSFQRLNAALDGLVAQMLISEEDAAKRKVNYANGANPVLLNDPEIADYGVYFDALLNAEVITEQDRAILAPFEQSRTATSEDLLVFTAATVLGTTPKGYPETVVIGVSYPADDSLFLSKSEQDLINSRILDFNSALKTQVDAQGLAFFDSHTYFSLAALNGGINVGSIKLDLDFRPNGIYSTDGVHLNARGQALMTNEIIKAIEEKYGSTIPKISADAVLAKTGVFFQ